MNTLVPNWSAICQDFDTELTALGNTGQQRQQLVNYLTTLWHANQERNLVSRKLTPPQLMTDHVLDSLVALAHLPAAKVVADLGTGGGLPAILLAIQRPQTQWLLYEKSPVKGQFLRSLRDITPNIDVMGPLADDGLPPQVDLVIARGFKSLAGILALTRNYYRNGGAYALYKARAAKIETERRHANLSSTAITVQPLQTYGDVEERHLVLMNHP